MLRPLHISVNLGYLILTLYILNYLSMDRCVDHLQNVGQYVQALIYQCKTVISHFNPLHYELFMH